jgi:hypothetical protein
MLIMYVLKRPCRDKETRISKASELPSGIKLRMATMADVA